jgi:hypothetical protein
MALWVIMDCSGGSYGIGGLWWWGYGVDYGRACASGTCTHELFFVSNLFPIPQHVVVWSLTVDKLGDIRYLGAVETKKFT